MIVLNPKELEKALQERQKILNAPEAGATIWRYYSLDKFLSLITSKRLFFSSAPSFEDPFEGDYGERAKESIRSQYGNGQYLQDLEVYRFLRPHTYVSCWYEDEYESFGMWKVYGEGVAVRTQFGNIHKLLTWSESEIKQAGRVNYIDYKTDHINVDCSYLPYFFKRKSFAHEREVRFLIQEYRPDWDDYPKPLPGKSIDLDLNNDIQEFVISPTMPLHVCDAIEKIIQQAGLTVPVRRSVLLNKPIW
ncbi:DUF2971 domain-containing protein [Chitinolyticbacter meiyuanensis]|uniref:DUF2971 domain-containing protein n=1 Tax=Chitinolyticbacter meiyuanensis TaxID=682798 RepID=UPI0011E59F93|nr:DUF2971 domain-containing protein [Chitinolyticbacter meiyuanensis]